ncbi:hypothetical protein G6F66_015176 [Rhizopus arrhizus]|nr:hypothetical protein G6F66_015176 [Rhizopus arrhizus]
MPAHQGRSSTLPLRPEPPAAFAAWAISSSAKTRSTDRVSSPPAARFSSSPTSRRLSSTAIAWLTLLPQKPFTVASL